MRSKETSSDFKNLLNTIPETLRLPVTCLNYMGLIRRGSAKQVICITLFSLLLLWLISIGTVQFANVKNISDFVNNLEGIFSEIQVLGKLMVLSYYSADLMTLLEHTKKFWKPNEISDKQEESELLSRNKITLKVQKCFYIGDILSSFLICLISWYQNTLLTGIWTYKGYDGLYYVVQSSQSTCAFCASLFICSILCLYFGFCVEMVTQFRMISYNLRDLGKKPADGSNMEKQSLENLKTYIIHHQYMKRCFGEFREIFSLMLFFEYITDVPVLLAELYAVQDDISFQMCVRRLVEAAFFTVQLALFCILTNYVSHEVSQIANYAYFSNWEDHLYSSLQAPLMLLMQNSQKEMIIKAGGLITINARTVVDVLKVAWSANSILKGLK